MAPENVMMMMKQYLSTMSKRIDDLVIKTKELEAELRKYGDSHQNVIEDVSEKVEKLSTDQEDTQTLLEKAREEWKKRSEDLEANLDGFANFESVTELQNKLDKEIETLRDEKLDRTDFQEFVDSTFTPLKELFSENEPSSSSFADFASAQSAAPKPEQREETPSVDVGEATPSETPPSNMPPSPPDQRRSDKKRKKWL